ncbi:MAG: rRNA maturation endonuclease Nob1 [Halobacteriales archaeon]|jgi:rRNA maturation endonuclease Nob1
MDSCNELGRRVERFKQNAEHAAEESADDECRTCDARFHTEYDECPECGAEQVTSRATTE